MPKPIELSTERLILRQWRAADEENRRSRAVMEGLGMQEAGPFGHPLLPEGSSLRPHRLYRLRREHWVA